MGRSGGLYGTSRGERENFFPRSCLGSRMSVCKLGCGDEWPDKGFGSNTKSIG